MKDQRVQFVDLREAYVTRTIKHQYEVREDVRFVWLQRFLCWLLRKIGAYATVEDLKYVRYTFDKKDFTERLFRNKETVMRFDCQPRQLIIGADDFAELMSLPEIRNYVSFDATYNYGRKILGLNVKVVPWMQGMVVVP